MLGSQAVFVGGSKVNLLLMVAVTSHAHRYFYYCFSYEAKVKQGDQFCHSFTCIVFYVKVTSFSIFFFLSYSTSDNVGLYFISAYELRTLLFIAI